MTPRRHRRALLEVKPRGVQAFGRCLPLTVLLSSGDQDRARFPELHHRPVLAKPHGAGERAARLTEPFGSRDPT